MKATFTSYSKKNQKKTTTSLTEPDARPCPDYAKEKEKLDYSLKVSLKTSGYSARINDLRR